MSTNIQVRPATAADATALRSFAEHCFRHAYAADNTPENMEAYCLHAFSEQQIAAELAHPGITVLLAEWQGQWVGYTKLEALAPAMPLPVQHPLNIGRLYVAPQYQRMGIGRLLLSHAVAWAQQHEHDYLWLSVWQQNPGAIAFYEQNGLQIIGTDTFQLGDDLQLDYLMGMPILPDQPTT